MKSKNGFIDDCFVNNNTDCVDNCFVDDSNGDFVDNCFDDSDDDWELDCCYECTGYGDDYYVDDDGELVCACDDCPLAIWRDDE